MNKWKKIGLAVCSLLLASTMLVGLAFADETAQPQATGGGLYRLETADNEESILKQTNVIREAEEIISDPVISDADPEMIAEIHSVQGITGSRRRTEQQPFLLTRINDYNTGAALGRCYAPADYKLNAQLMYAGDNVSDCSVSNPYQLGILATSPDGRVEMLYKSRMCYLYLPNEYHEGQIYGGLEMMLYPMTAGEFADYVMLKMAAGVPEIRRVSGFYSTDEEDAFLAEQSEYYKNYMNPEFLYMPMETVCDQVYSTSADYTYRYEWNGQMQKTRIITMTNQLRFMMYGTIATVAEYQTYVPYIYILSAPEEEFDEAEQIFELFVANTRVTDEFVILNTLRAEELIAWMSIGMPIDLTIDEDDAAILGYGNGTFDTEQFCDYIRDENEYTTSDGRSFKVPTSFDYVYEGDDGTIYVTNSTEQPAGSTRLYAN